MVNARVIDYNKGGLIVDVAGIRGFIPLSQIFNLTREEVAVGGESQEVMTKLQRMKGKELQLKIIEINRARNRLILSERLAIQEWRLLQENEIGFEEALAEGVHICPSCKREVQANWKHCMYCGSSLAKKCPHCGAPRVAVEGARYCFACGSPLE